MELDTRGQPFDLAASLESGQAFRWIREQEGAHGWFSGVVQGNLIRIRQTNQGTVEFHSSQPVELTRHLLHSYFRLDDDTETIYREISKEGTVKALVQKFWGLRLLRQEPWECLVAYLCSGNNSVARISQIVEKLAESFGHPIRLGDATRYSFPTPERLATAEPEELEALRLGLNRGVNIHRAAGEVSAGALDLYALTEMPYPEALKRLRDLPGVGPKIANCVLLFSLDKPEAFPIDRWIGRAMAEEGASNKELTEWANIYQEEFGQYAGYAGQFLFHDMRERQKLIQR